MCTAILAQPYPLSFHLCSRRATPRQSAQSRNTRGKPKKAAHNNNNNNNNSHPTTTGRPKARGAAQRARKSRVQTPSHPEPLSPKVVKVGPVFPRHGQGTTTKARHRCRGGSLERPGFSGLGPEPRAIARSRLAPLSPKAPNPQEFLLLSAAEARAPAVLFAPEGGSQRRPNIELIA